MVGRRVGIWELLVLRGCGSGRNLEGLAGDMAWLLKVL